jgi:glutaconate CoA-transferase subunit A
MLPTWVIDAVAEAPGGTYPSYTAGYSDRDNAYYVAWDAISRDRDTFVAWVEKHIMQTSSAVSS